MNRTTQVYRDPPSEIRWYWIFIVSKILLLFVWIYFRWIISLSRHLSDIFIHKGIFCTITWSLCLILTSFFVPICVHMTRADYEWPFRKPLIWYDEFLRVTWENKRWQFNGNAFTSGVHTLENKMPLFLLALLLVFAF